MTKVLEKRIYIDTEFTGLKQNTKLISIGIVTDAKESFYAEMGNYDIENLDPWILENVIRNLRWNPGVGGISYQSNSPKGVEFGNCHGKISDEILRFHMLRWLYEVSEQGKYMLTLVSDVCHYDMVLFTNIFGEVRYMPNYICPACYDINQDISRLYNISMMEAFNLDRTSIAGINPEDNNIKQHNALDDAKVIRACYQKLTEV